MAAEVPAFLTTSHSAIHSAKPISWVWKEFNLKGILETMWEKIVQRKKPEFQNVEDAHRQLQQQLLRQAKRTLVVLDDV